jgi:uncharacterized membrane protein YeaQ/YmgE (transglycosylase-associated protein family)
MIAADISFWTVVWYAFAGLVIGVLARLFMPGRQNMNIVATILLGVIAAVAGAFCGMRSSWIRRVSRGSVGSWSL